MHIIYHHISLTLLLFVYDVGGRRFYRRRYSRRFYRGRGKSARDIETYHHLRLNICSSTHHTSLYPRYPLSLKQFVVSVVATLGVAQIPLPIQQNPTIRTMKSTR